MPILNYTTKISVHKTVGEIQEKLARAGALSVSIDYDDNKQPNGITFFIFVKTTPVNFRLPSRWEGVYNAINKDKNIPKSYKNEEQARKVAWRIIKDWLEAQLAIIDAELASLPEIFLPYAVTNTGKTLFQEFNDSGGKFLLGDGEK